VSIRILKYTPRALAGAAVFAFAPACSGEAFTTAGSGMSGSGTGRSASSGTSAASGTMTSGAPASGAASGSSASGSSGATSGTASSGGTVDDGGADASHDAPVACFQDGGVLVRQAKVCYAVDSECAVLVVSTCCGANLAVGLSKIEPQYAACYPQAGPNSCRGLGCAKFLGTLTDDGQLGTSEPVARCVVGAGGGQCMTRHAPLDSGVGGG
jgi:hypothetical protein